MGTYNIDESIADGDPGQLDWATRVAGAVNDLDLRTIATEAASSDSGVAGKVGTAIAVWNVRNFGAVPTNQNGGEGANAAIQAAVDFAAGRGGGEVVVDDDYWIKAHVPGAVGNSLLDEGGIALKDGVHLRFTANGIFRVIPTTESKYQCIRIYAKNNVRISGPGRIIGERAAHLSTGGEWGFGVTVFGGSNITIEDITTTNMWGDGIDITRVVILGTLTVPKNVAVRNVTSDGNRRQGLSLEAGNWVKITDSRFTNTGGVGGTLPMNGIDVEPSADTTQCSNVVIQRCWFENNSGFGCSVYMLGTRDVAVDDCDFVSNKGAWQFACNLAGPNVRLTRSRFSGTVTECVHITGGVGRIIADNMFDNKLRIAPNATGNIATYVTIARNQWSVNSAAVVSGLVEINEHSAYTEVLDNTFENKGARGSGIWIRVAASVAPLTLQTVRIRGNTFINMSNAITTGSVSNIRVEENRIDASSDSAIIFFMLVGGYIRGNRISGSNLVTGVAAVRFGANSTENLVAGNKFEIDPVTTVVETRRGTTAFRFDFGPTLNTTIRDSHLRGALAYYVDMGTRTGSYFETTPGTWV